MCMALVYCAVVCTSPPSVLLVCFSFKKSAPRRKCAACKIVVHTGCIEQLEKVSNTQTVNP